MNGCRRHDYGVVWLLCGKVNAICVVMLYVYEVKMRAMPASRHSSGDGVRPPSAVVHALRPRPLQGNKPRRTAHPRGV